MKEYLLVIRIFDNNSYYFMKQTSILLMLLVASFAFTIEKKTQHISKIEIQADKISFSDDGKDEDVLKDNVQHLEVDQIYYGGTIITMNAKDQILEAIALHKGKIVKAGSSKQILQFAQNGGVQLLNLRGKTMLPGFYDPHSHLAYLALTKSLGFKISSPPIGDIKSIADLQNSIRNFIKENNIPSDVVIYGSSYNDLGLAQRRHPSRYDLDQISTEHIIALDHISGHMAAVNSRAIEVAGVTDQTPNPAGGNIERFESGPFAGKVYGVFKEKAKYLYIDQFKKKMDLSEASEKIILEGSQDYIESGVTTAQQGYMGKQNADLYLQMKDKLQIDVRGYFACIDEFSKDFDQYVNQMTSRFKVGGIKITVDGSIQGYTGYLTNPYYVQPVESEVPHKYLCSNGNKQCPLKKENELISQYKKIINFNKIVKKQTENNTFRGYSTYNQSQVDSMVEGGIKRGIDILAHCNGDASGDMYLSAIAKAKAKYPESKSRLTMIHAQTVRDDQLDIMVKYQVTPSFFIGHTYYWGDEHRDKFLGPVRASRISPARTAQSKGLNFTFHNDAPIVPMSNNGVFMIIWSAVNRLTQSGQILGPQQRVSVYEALKGVTIRSAYQGNEDHIKGSIQPGKLADLIIVSDNPLKIDPMLLRNITVLETIKEGKTIFRRHA